jgi:uncharacterized protein YaaR (DUF327 family)
MDTLPSYQGFLDFMEGKDSEERQKVERTEEAKEFCKTMDFEAAEKDVANRLKDKGRSKGEKEAIEEMWSRVKKRGNLFKGQRAEGSED